MENYGSIFREMRQSRQMSLKQVADEMISLSQLSRFERGESDITLEKLLSILGKIKVAPLEFLNRVFDYQVDAQVHLLRDMMRSHYQKDIEKLKKLSLSQKAIFEKDKTQRRAKLNHILIEGAICEHQKEYQMTKENLDFLSDHLFCTTVWGIDELILVGNLYRFYDNQTIQYLMKEVLERHYFYESSTYKNVIEISLLNVMETMIERECFEEAEYYLKKLEPLLDNERKAYQRILMLYEKGYLKFAKGHQKEGLRQMQQAIACFETIGCDYHVTYFKDHMAQVTKD